MFIVTYNNVLAPNVKTLSESFLLKPLYNLHGFTKFKHTFLKSRQKFLLTTVKIVGLIDSHYLLANTQKFLNVFESLAIYHRSSASWIRIADYLSL